MPDETLRVVDRQPGRIAKHLPDRHALFNVSLRGRRRVGAQDVDRLRLQLGPLQGQPHALGLSFRIRQHEVAGIGVDGVAHNLAVDLRTPPEGVGQPLEGAQASPFGDHNPIAGEIEGARGAGWLGMRRQRPLAVEAGEDAESVNALRHTPHNRQVDIAQPELLHPLDEANVPRGTRRPQRVVRPGNSQAEGHLARRVVRHRAGIVVVRPDLGVVVELRDLVDLVLGLDVAVLGDPQVDAHPIPGNSLPVQPGVANRLVRTIDRNGPGPRPPPHFFALLVTQLIESADPGQHRTHVAGLERDHPRLPCQQVLPVFGQAVANRTGEADARDHNPLARHNGTRHARSCVRSRSRRDVQKRCPGRQPQGRSEGFLENVSRSAGADKSPPASGKPERLGGPPSHRPVRPSG